MATGTEQVSEAERASSDLAGLLAEYRADIDRAEDSQRLADADKKRRAASEARVMAAMKAARLCRPGDSVRGAGLTVTWRQKWRATYDPLRWKDIMAWAAATGHEYLVQRRITDSRVMELVDAGTPLPEGLGVEMYEEIDHRRAT